MKNNDFIIMKELPIKEKNSKEDVGLWVYRDPY